MSGKTISCDIIDEVEQPKNLKRQGQTPANLVQKRQRVAKSLEIDSSYESFFSSQQKNTYKMGHCLKKLNEQTKQFWARFEMSFSTQDIANSWLKELVVKKLMTPNAPFLVEMAPPSPNSGCVRVFGVLCIRGEHRWEDLTKNVFLCGKELRENGTLKEKGVVFSSVKFGYYLGSEYIKKTNSAEMDKMKKENEDLRLKLEDLQRHVAHQQTQPTINDFYDSDEAVQGEMF